MANDHLLWKQVLSSRGSCGHALQAIVLSRAYGAAFKYTVFDCPSTPSNPLFPRGKQESNITVEWPGAIAGAQPSKNRT